MLTKPSRLTSILDLIRLSTDLVERFLASNGAAEAANCPNKENRLQWHGYARAYGSDHQTSKVFTRQLSQDVLGVVLHFDSCGRGVF